jgi:hypothetical protein
VPWLRSKDIITIDPFARVLFATGGLGIQAMEAKRRIKRKRRPSRGGAWSSRFLKPADSLRDVGRSD